MLPLGSPLVRYTAAPSPRACLHSVGSTGSWAGILARQSAPDGPQISRTKPVDSPVTGWRAWRLDESDMWLHSPIIGTPWNPCEMMIDLVEDHAESGISAWKEQSEAQEYAASNDVPSVVGSVHLWGDIIEYATGYRANFAAILSLTDIYHSECDLADVRRFYMPLRVIE